MINIDWGTQVLKRCKKVTELLFSRNGSGMMVIGQYHDKSYHFGLKEPNVLMTFLDVVDYFRLVSDHKILLKSKFTFYPNSVRSTQDNLANSDLSEECAQ